ncbi:MAG: hypothetical protein ACREQZ_09340 [Woeseiaceae bacterium]
MIRSRPRAKPKRGPQLSHDAHNKMHAALGWYFGRYKTDPQYARAPFYYDAVLKWFEALSFDSQDLVHTVHEVYTRPGWGERVAETHASDLPAVPRWPFESRG